MAETPRFARLEDGSVVALDPMPDVLRVPTALLAGAAQRWLTVTITLRLANGTWTYRVREQDGEVVICDLHAAAPTQEEASDG